MHSHPLLCRRSKVDDGTSLEMQDKLSRAMEYQSKGSMDQLKARTNVSDGTFFEICQKILLDDNSLSIKSKFFLSASWNAIENLRLLMAAMPLDAGLTPKSTEYFFEGEALAFAAFHDSAEVMEILYEFGLMNEYLDAMIGFELGFLECNQGLSVEHRRSKQYSLTKDKQTGSYQIALKSPKSPKMLLVLERYRIQNDKREMLKHDSSCPSLLTEDVDDMNTSVDSIIKGGICSYFASRLKSAVIHVVDDNDHSGKKDMNWYNINFLVDHER